MTQQFLPVFSKVIDCFNVIKFSVDPVNPIQGKIDGDAVWPTDVAVDQGVDFTAVHIGPVYPRVRDSPVGEEHVPENNNCYS